MADLKSKLGRLQEPPAGPGDDREATLDGLRRKMDDLLGRDAAAPPERPKLSLDALPFIERETDSGPLFQNIERLPASHHVGRMPVAAGADARPEMLALLALDPRLTECDPARALYLDTETTGLGGGAGTVAFLVGLAWFDDEGRLSVEQLMLRQPGEERPLLEVVAERIYHASFLVTYNGKAFDLPLLNNRYVMNKLDPLPDRAHLDLLHVARRLHKARLGSCRLTAMESEVLGFVRGEDIDGAEVPQRYSHFLRTGDAESLSAVVEHNAWDVMSMAALVGLYGEPLDALHPEDLAALAKTLKRARALDQAAEVANVAVEQGGGTEALRARGEIAKARGDRMSALVDFETLTGEIDDPKARLELAKLYEHHVKEPLKALQIVEQGTGESDEDWKRRHARLERKIAKNSPNREGE